MKENDKQKNRPIVDLRREEVGGIGIGTSN
jgi:hypothetical protein